MKKLLSTLLIFGCLAILYSQNIQFTDQVLKAKLLQSSPDNMIATNTSGTFFAIDADGDGEISFTEAALVQGLRMDYAQIMSISDLQNFPNLVLLHVGNNSLTSLNLTGFTKLEELRCNWTHWSPPMFRRQ
ncbi:protein phosphatase 1 regulatory subunit 42 [Chryseobacterium suipulveris]|uniref:Protein phosphatase 1 regulatory subunit 42 n=1 Tax=Chryseobacterium suipulveris TaxID=2929800 RepID=A0ABY4BUR9_9FLAO|nr:protein phosphatase 1 regulatory subunit 42 [Chryseobacterium suipulveris]UOE41942.1 protein phosphatase 1 regulatory subunit 42 [Chryseobacterium suipulveris]